MELIFWSSVGLTIVAVISVVILIIKFYNPNPLRMIAGIITTFIAMLFLVALRLVKNGKVNNDEDIPGRSEAPTGRAKIVNKEVPQCENDYTFTERPFIDLYN